MKKVLLTYYLLLGIIVTAVSSPANIGDKGYKVGDTAMDFSLKGVDGKYYSLSDYNNVNGYIVVFTCNTCPVSRAYEERIMKLADKAKEEGFVLLAINPNDPDIQPGDSYEQMQIRAKERSFNFPYLFDDGQKVYPEYGALRTPYVFVLNKNRRVEYIGAIDDNTNDPSRVNNEYVFNAMKMLNKGKSPDPSFTRAIGCGIKSKA